MLGGAALQLLLEQLVPGGAWGRPHRAQWFPSMCVVGRGKVHLVGAQELRRLGMGGMCVRRRGARGWSWEFPS